jgi:rhodanese-related sulfurtransferase
MGLNARRCAGLGLMLFLAHAPVALAQNATPERMTAQVAHNAAIAGDIVLLDIRSPEEWRETGLPASGFAVTMHQSKESFLAEVAAAAGGSKTKSIALICATGNRSARMQDWLRQAGYTSVADVSEGMVGGTRGTGWLRSGLPIRRWSPGKTAP